MWKRTFCCYCCLFHNLKEKECKDADNKVAGNTYLFACPVLVETLAHFYLFCRAQGSLFSIYKDANAGMSSTLQSEIPKLENTSWHCLGARADRNKENQAIPSKWTSNKVRLSPESSK